MTREELKQAAFEAAMKDEDFAQELEAKREEQAILDRHELQRMRRDNPLLGDNMVGNTLRAIGLGAAEAGFEAKDAVQDAVGLGATAEEDKSGLRKSFEAQDRALDAQSPGYGLTSGVSQIIVGLVGVGKVLGKAKLAKNVEAMSKLGYETGKTALASYLVLDPHEERLSDFIETVPALQNPVTEFLAADDSDTEMEGRLKNAVESIGLDLGLVYAVKAIKYLRAGKQEEALKEIGKIEAGQADKMAVEPVQGDLAEAAPSPAQGVEPEAAPVESPKAEAPVDAPQATPKEATIEQVGTKPMFNEKGQPVLPTQAVGPEEIRVQGMADEELDSILQTSKADTEAVAKFGSREEATAQGHKFAQAKLPWQKLYLPGESEDLVARTAAVLAKRFDAAKGGAVMSDQRVMDLVDELADTYNAEPALILGQLSEAGAKAPQMVSEMEAALRIGNKMFLDVGDLVTKIRAGNLDEFGGNPELANATLKARLGLALDTLAAGNSMLANAGRSLRRARSEFRFDKKTLAKLQAMDPEKVAVILEKAGSDPKKAAMILNETWGARVMNEASWYLTNGLLWMWPTHVVNTTTNALMLVARPTEKLFGSAALQLLTKDPARKAELSSISKQAMREYMYTVSSLKEGWDSAVEAFLRGDSLLNPQNTEAFEIGSKIDAQPIEWKPMASVMDLAENAYRAATWRNAVGLPTRALGGADEFFKTLRYRAVVQSRAAVAAADMGLTGAEARRYIQDALDKAIDPATGKALDRNVALEAQRVSFQQDLDYETSIGGSLGRGIQSMRRVAPITSLVLPFVKTPVNVMRYGIKLTPGLNVVQKEFRDAIGGKAGNEAQAHAFGQMMLGSMFMGLAAHLAATGSFTGSGPSDPNLVAELEATGWKPFAFTWIEDGKRQYFQLGKFDPMALPMSLVADIVALKQKDPDRDVSDLILAAGVAISKGITDKTFLLNLDMAIGAALEPEKRLPKYLGRTVGSALPFSGLGKMANPDLYLREARSLVDSAMANVPGLSQQLPVRMDVFGDPVERFIGLMDEREPDIVVSEHNRIMLQTDKGLGKPDSKFEGVDLRDITLGDGKNAYQAYQELAGHLPGRKSLKEELARIIRSDAYQAMGDGDRDVKGTRINYLGTFVSKYRAAAKFVLIKKYPELKPHIKARQVEARGTFLENRKKRRQGEPGARELLEALTP